MKETVVLPKLLDFQSEIMEWVTDDTIKTISLNKSRQTGGSFLMKSITSYWVLSSNSRKVGYCCPTYKICKLFYNDLTRSLSNFIESKNSQELTIRFNTGSSLQFVSAESGDAIRGMQFTELIVDEAAFISESFFEYVLRPTILVIGRKLILCSTPNGNNGFFYKNVMLGINKTKGYKTKMVNIYDNKFVSREEIENIKASVTDKVFRQEYLGEFLSGRGTVFSNFNNCICTQPELNGKYYAAIDWAKQNDYTVLTIINSKKQVVYTYRVTGLDYTKQIEEIVRILNKWKPVITISEENNIGAVINELLKKAYKGRLDCVTLSNTLKKDIIEGLVIAFEQGLIGIPNDEVLLGELGAFTCIYNSSTQSVKYTAPIGLHDDMVISLAYAYNAVNSTKGIYYIR